MSGRNRLIRRPTILPPTRVKMVLVAAIVASLIAVTLIGVARWQSRNIAQAYWAQRIKSTPEAQLPAMLEELGQRADASELLVELLNHEQADVALAARRVLGFQITQWHELPPAESSPHVAELLAALADRTVDFRRRGQHLASLVASDLMTWPFDEKEVDIAGALENIEVIIRHDHGPDSLLDDAGRKQFAVRPTSQPRIPFIAQARSSDHIPSDIGIPNLAGGQLPIEPLPGREITTQDTVDEPDEESQAGVTKKEPSAALPPAEIYEPLAIPLRMAPPSNTQADNDSIVRSNEPVSISPQLTGQEQTWSDTELMRLLHDAERSAMAEEQLRSRGFDTLRLEIARRLTHQDPSVRRELADSITRIAGVDPRPWLEELAVDSNPDVRRIAISILGTSGDPAIDRWLLDLRGEETNPQVAEMIDNILQKRR